MQSVWATKAGVKLERLMTTIAVRDLMHHLGLDAKLTNRVR